MHSYLKSCNVAINKMHNHIPTKLTGLMSTSSSTLIGPQDKKICVPGLLHGKTIFTAQLQRELQRKGEYCKLEIFLRILF